MIRSLVYMWAGLVFVSLVLITRVPESKNKDPSYEEEVVDDRLNLKSDSVAKVNHALTQT